MTPVLKSRKNFSEPGKSRKNLLSPIDLKITVTILQETANKLSVFSTLKSQPFLRYRPSKFAIIRENDNLRNKLKHSDKTKIRCIAVLSITVTILEETTNKQKCTPHVGRLLWVASLFCMWVASNVGLLPPNNLLYLNSYCIAT